MDWAITAVSIDRTSACHCQAIKIGLVYVESVQKKFGQESFAAGADRNAILFLDQTQHPQATFIEFAFSAMLKITITSALNNIPSPSDLVLKMLLSS